MELATAYVGVQFKDSPQLVSGAASAGAKAGKAAGDAVDKGLEKGSKDGSRKAVQNISNLATQIRGAFVLGAAVKGLQTIIGAASDLNEEVSKSKVIFGEANAAAVREFAKGAAAIGQSEKQALQAAGTFAVFGKAAGLAGQDLVDFSLKSDQLASDLASFFNTSPDQAIQAIGAAFRGESEPIRAYGVLLNDAALKQEALDEGLIKTTSGTLPQAARVQAAYGLIMKQTTDAQGDFARTSDGVANSSRIVAAQFENAKASLGQSLLPVFQQMLKFASLLIGVFDALPAPVKTATVALLAFAAVRGPVMALGGALQGIGATFLALPSWVAPAVAIIGAASIIMADMGSGVDETTDKYKDFTKTLATATGNIKSHVAELTKMASEQDSTRDAMFKLGITQDQLTEISGKSRDEQLKWIDSLHEVQKGNEDGTKAVDELATRLAAIDWSIASAAALQFKDAVQTLGAQGIAKLAEESGATEEQVIQLGAALYDGSLNANQLAISGLPLIQIMTRVAAAMLDAKKKTDEQGKSATTGVDPNNELFKTVQGVSDAYDAAASAANEFKSALDKLLGPTLDLAAASDAAIADQQGLQKAFEDARKGIDGNTKTLDQYTEAGRANREVIKQSVEKELAYAEALVKSGGSTEDAALKVEQYRQNLIAQAIQSGLSSEEVDAYIKELGLTPEQVQTAIKLAELETAKKDIQGWIDKLNNEPGSDGVPKEVETAIKAALAEGDIATARKILNNFIAENRPPVSINVRLAGLTGLNAAINTAIFGGIAKATANVPPPGDSSNPPEKAHGGPVDAGRLYRVNEFGPTKGPEFFVPDVSGKIVPLGDAIDSVPAQVSSPVIYAGITVHGTIVDMGTLDRWADERDRRVAAIIGAN